MILIGVVLLAAFLLFPLTGLRRVTAFEKTLPALVGSGSGGMTGAQRDEALEVLESWVNARRLSLGVLQTERDDSSISIRFWIGLTHLYQPPLQGI